MHLLPVAIDHSLEHSRPHKADAIRPGSTEKKVRRRRPLLLGWLLRRFLPLLDRLHVEFPFGLYKDDTLRAGVAPRRVPVRRRDELVGARRQSVLRPTLRPDD